MVKTPTNALIALGSNQPCDGLAPDQILSGAVKELASASDEVVAVSSFYQTPCFPTGAGPDYVNAALLLKTQKDAHAVLHHLHEVEAAYDRERKQRWGQRTLDLDLLAFGDHVVPDPTTYQSWVELSPEDQKLRAPDQLILPHPRMHERAFVLIPLGDVAPDWVHPILKRRVVDLIQALPVDEIDAVRRL